MAKKSQSLGTAILFLQADMKQLFKGLKLVGKLIEKAAKKWGRSFRMIGRNLSTAGAAFTRLGGMAAAAFGAIGLAIKKTTDAYAVQQAAEAQLAAVLKSTGEAAGLTAEELTKMASALQDVTTFGDEAIIGAESILLTFKNIRTEAFEPTLEAVLDMSTAMKTDLKSSAVLVGKALNDPVKGLSALSRVGITFTEKQEKVIKKLAETGQVAKAQGLILEELESQFGGSARAAATTFGGAIIQLKNIWGDFLEDIGKRFGPAIGQAVEALRPFVLGLRAWIAGNETLGPTLERFASELIPALAVAARSLWESLAPLVKSIAEFIIRNPKAAAQLTLLAVKFTALSLTLGPVLFGLGQIFTAVGSLIALAPKLLSVFKFAFSGMGAALIGLTVAAAAFIEMWSSGDWTQNFITRWVDSIEWVGKSIDWLFDKLVAYWNWWSEKAGAFTGLFTGGDSGGGQGFSGSVPAFASGGVMPSAGAALVGEKGPEIVMLPGGAEVIPNGGGMGGMTFSGNLIGTAVINSEMDIRKVSADLFRELKREVLNMGGRR